MGTKSISKLSLTCCLLALAMIFTAAATRAELLNIPDEPADWNGFYAGVNFGGLFDHFDIHGHDTFVDITEQYYNATGDEGQEGHNFALFSVPGHDATNGSAVGSFDIGYNHQWNHFVAGIAGGVSVTHSYVTTKFSSFQQNSIFPDRQIQPQQIEDAQTYFRSFDSVQQNWSAYIGGQIGYAFNRWLFYVTGGAAFTDVDFSSFDDANSFFGFDDDIVQPHEPPPFQESNNRSLVHDDCFLVGWYIGGGTLFAITDTISAGIEYHHSDYGTATFHPAPDDAVFPNHISVDLTSDEVVFKLNVNLSTFFGSKH